VRERIEDEAERARLVAAFELSQSVYRKDPWAEEARKARAYAPLADTPAVAAE
jgi:nitrite reductase (NADH) large subunit